MQKLSEQLNAAKVEIHDLDGHYDYSFVKSYVVSGRCGGLKIIVGPSENTKSLLCKVEELERQIKGDEQYHASLSQEKEDAEDEVEKLNNELNDAERAIEDFEDKTGLTTNARSLNIRILELTDLVLELQEKASDLLEENIQLESQVKELTVDNNSLAWQIKELTK